MYASMPPGLPRDDRHVRVLFPSKQALDSGISMDQIMQRTPVAVFNPSTGKLTNLQGESQRIVDRIEIPGIRKLPWYHLSRIFKRTSAPLVYALGMNEYHSLDFPGLDKALSYLAEKHPQVQLLSADCY